MAVTMILTDYIPFIVGIGATFLTLWSTVPQIKKTMKTKEADDVSKWLIISLIAGLSLYYDRKFHRHVFECLSFAA
jgi:uncharacterized protein with PQ loop repeat